MGMIEIGSTGVPIKAWVEGVQVEDQAKTQLQNIARLPVVGPHIAVMPDVHLGKGATVGSVVPTFGAIIPAAVGVDIGCGMMAVKLDLKPSELPDSLAAMRFEIESAVPHGRTANGGKGDRGAWGIIPSTAANMWRVMQSHHNYAWKEIHFGRDLWITRKGAVNASVGSLGIIPGSMGAKSFIVRGKGNAESFNSCSHGAGRKMSRNEAKRTFTLEDHAKATEGVECRKDEGVIDETPGCYKDIDDVMSAQSDLVEIVTTLKQVLVVKG